MSSKNLSTVANDLIASYGATAQNLIRAYRLGNERVIGFMDRRWEKALRKSADQLDAEVRGNARSAQQKLSGYYSKGLAMTTDGAGVVVSKVVELAGKGVAQLAANAGRFEKRTGVSALNSLAHATVPAAEVVSKLASRIAYRSSQLADKLGGKAASAKRPTAFRKARARKAA